MSANDRQVAGDHYCGKMQHWDLAADRSYDYFQGQITKYVDRWKKKNGLIDLEKAMHFLEKYIELVREGKIHDAPKTDYVPTQRQKEVAEKFEDLRIKNENALGLILKNYADEPLSNGYVNQDGVKERKWV